MSLLRTETHSSKVVSSREFAAAHRPRAREYFFFALSLFYAAVAIGGFAPELYSSVDLAHPRLAYVHGGLMTAWLLLFIMQTGFASFGLLRRHRTTGVIAIGIAGAMWVSMGVVSMAQLTKFKSYDVLLTQFAMMVLFALFFVPGILFRKHAGAHKRLLTLSTLVLLQPALDRMSWLPGFGLVEYWPQAIWLYPLLLPLILFDVFSTRGLHPVTLTGAVVIALAHTLISSYWTTPGWLNFARAVTGATQQATKTSAP